MMIRVPEAMTAMQFVLIVPDVILGSAVNCVMMR
jgi:hypothetical protein